MSVIEFSARHRFPSGFELHVEFASQARVTALFGPSGSGKSSVLAIVAGLLRADNVSLRLGQRTLADERVWLAPEKRGVGLVAQDAQLFPHLDVSQNLRYGSRRRARGTRASFERAVEMLELGSLLEARPDELSGGQRQRVALGRALLSGPDLLLLDEPLTGLEEGLRDRILGYVERVVREWAIPALVVTHDQLVVRRLAETVVVLEAGRVVDAGPALMTLDRALLGPTRSGGAAGAMSGPLNLLRIELVERRGSKLVGRLGDQELHLPAETPLAPPGSPGSLGSVGSQSSQAQEPSTVHAHFLASDVALARGDVSGLSMRNHVRGSIERIEVDASAERAFVAVALGSQRLWAELTLDAVAELELRPGVEVYCFIKTRAMRISS